jgi:hypothetical protein
MSTILSQDPVSVCLFTFADGRHCRLPRAPGHLHLCTFHARKEEQIQAAQQVGRNLSSYFSGNYLSACDLSSALGHLMSAVAQGDLKPKTATTLAYLSQTLLHSIQLSQREFINAFGTDSWRKEIRSSFARSSSDHAGEIAEEAPQQRQFAPLPADPASYLESTLAKVYQNK